MSSTPAPTPGATMHGTRMGTPGYMAPEQTGGDIARIDERTDVYGLGAILGFLLQKTAQPIPRRLRAIRNRALAGEPSDRYASATALAADITRFLDGLSVTAYRENPFERTARFVSRYRTAIALVLTYMILRVLFVLFGQ